MELVLWRLQGGSSLVSIHTDTASSLVGRSWIALSMFMGTWSLVCKAKLIKSGILLQTRMNIGCQRRCKKCCTKAKIFPCSMDISCHPTISRSLVNHVNNQSPARVGKGEGFTLNCSSQCPTQFLSLNWNNNEQRMIPSSSCSFWNTWQTPYYYQRCRFKPVIISHRAQ